MSAIQRHARETPDVGRRISQAVELLRHAEHQHPGTVVQATSLGAEDMVITDLIARHGLNIDIATLDTGLLHPQTHALIEEVEAHYRLVVKRYLPVATAVIDFVQRHGEDAMFRSVALRQGCCTVRKLAPLQRLLQGRTAWLTGLRREQSDNRADVPFVEAGADGRLKFNPLADWSWADVWHYIAQHQVPYNPLHDAFYASIGCAPCTRAIAAGEPMRAGRWWWEHDAAKECGLHAHPTPPAPQRPEFTVISVSRPHAGPEIAAAPPHVGQVQGPAHTLRAHPPRVPRKADA